MKPPCRRNTNRIRCMLTAMFEDISLPLFMLCLIPACSTGFLLALLLAWKAAFFPAAVPHLLWWLFLPLWLSLSCFLPSVIASCILSSRNHHQLYRHAHLCTACTAELLLAHLWTLTVLYRFPPVICMAVSAGISIVCLFSLPASFRFCDGAGVLTGLCAIWNLYLTVMWIFL